MRGLVLSGGGAKGAYQAGAIYGLTGMGRTYDVITGISVGAINGAFLAQYRRGQEFEGAKVLREMWGKIKNKDVYRKGLLWPLNVLFKESVYDTSPLRKLLEKWIDPQKVIDSGKKLRLGATNIITGTYTVFSFPEAGPELLIDAVMASSAFPAFLTPIEIEGSYYFDGGPRNVTPVKSAIQAGVEAIDVVVCSPKNIDHYQGKITAAKTAIRAVDIMGDEVMDKDIKLLDTYNQLVKHSVPGYEDKVFVDFEIYRPTAPVLYNPLKFDPRVSSEIFAQGMEDFIDKYISGTSP